MAAFERSSCAALLAALLIGVGGSASATAWEKVAAEGEASPEGRPYGALLLASRIADDGAVSFADVPYSPLPNPPVFALWRWPDAGGVEPLATIQEPIGNGNWRWPGLVANRAGDLAVRSGRAVVLLDCGMGETSEQAREFLRLLPRGGDLALVAATGEPAPGEPGLTLARLLAPAFPSFPGRPFAAPSLLLGEDGTPFFGAEVADDPCFVDGAHADFVRALFAPDGAGATLPIALEGEPLPGASGDETLRLESVQLAEAGPGALLVHTDFDDPSVPTAGVALLRWAPLAGGLETLARSDEPSAWLGGAWLASFSEPRTSPGGVVALGGVRDESEPWPLAGRNGIWVGDADGLEEVVPLAGPVPGGPEGAEFVPLSFVFSAPLVNDAGEIAFAAPFRPAPAAAPTSGVFAPGPGGSPVLRITIGDPAPGAGGLLFGSLSPLHLAPNGDLLVLALLSELPPIATENAERAWYLVPRSGPPVLLLRESDEIELGPGDVRSLEYAGVAYDDALTRIAVRVGVIGLAPEVIAVRPVPEPCAPLAGAGAVIALGLLASRRARRLPIRTQCRVRPSSGS
ncbi:MAG TPA: hypothetical protein VLC53_07200 [Myxococcota bacterium]|nr:hypothetical protein [Myxococcota bacterium]